MQETNIYTGLYQMAASIMNCVYWQMICGIAQNWDIRNIEHRRGF